MTAWNVKDPDLADIYTSLIRLTARLMYYPVIKCFPALEVFLTIHKDVGLLPDVFFMLSQEKSQVILD